jgi:hypothetical protein
MMYDVPSMAVFCKESIECCPGIVSRYLCIIIIIIIIIICNFIKLSNYRTFADDIQVFSDDYLSFCSNGHWLLMQLVRIKSRVA